MSTRTRIGFTEFGQFGGVYFSIHGKEPSVVDETWNLQDWVSLRLFTDYSDSGVAADPDFKYLAVF